MKASFLTFVFPLACLAFAPLAPAADAFFMPDGKTVITSVAGAPFTSLKGLAKIDIPSGKVTPIPLPPGFEEIDSIARGAEGEILFLAKDAVWVLKNGEPPRKIVSTAPLKHPSDLFVCTDKGSSVHDWLFVTGSEEPKNKDETIQRAFYGRKPGSKKFEAIFCRRVENAVAGAYSTDGRLFFVSSGDVWEGEIADSSTTGGWLGTLTGIRLAPVAFGNTDLANAGSLQVMQVCPAGKWVYTYLQGHHMGDLVRTPIPTKPAYGKGSAELPTLDAHYAALSRALAKTEVIPGDFEYCYGLCATEVNGKPQLFFYTRDGQPGAALMLWTGAGEPKLIGRLPPSKE